MTKGIASVLPDLSGGVTSDVGGQLPTVTYRAIELSDHLAGAFATNVVLVRVPVDAGRGGNHTDALT